MSRPIVIQIDVTVALATAFLAERDATGMRYHTLSQYVAHLAIAAMEEQRAQRTADLSALGWWRHVKNEPQPYQAPCG
jgi:hypothetical protein